jgi:hypothetical protein
MSWAARFKERLIAGLGCLVVGVCVGWYLHKAPVKEVIKWQTRIETRYQTVEKIVTRPGATVYLQPDGSTIITGPVEITRSTSGQSSETTTGTHAIQPVEKSRLAGGGAGIDRDLAAHYGGIYGQRVLGPFWLVGQVSGSSRGPCGYVFVTVLW